jgi:dTMP kinase
MMQGKLIVMEGIDGSGKSTQYRGWACSGGRGADPVPPRHLPRYQEESSALIRAYLGGAFGSNPSDVNPYAASTFYAVDRFASFRTDWGAYYQKGGLVLCDRYTTSNACHQGAKLAPAERRAFLDWLGDFEYGKMGLPAPQLVLYLDVELEAARRQMAARQRETHTRADIHETDFAYLAACLEPGALPPITTAGGASPVCAPVPCAPWRRSTRTFGTRSARPGRGIAKEGPGGPSPRRGNSAAVVVAAVVVAAVVAAAVVVAARNCRRRTEGSGQ